MRPAPVCAAPLLAATLALGGAAAFFPLPARAAADSLAPYRALCASAAGARLVALARRAMAAYLADSAAAPAPGPGGAPDSLAPPDWPGPPTGVYLSLVSGAATRACVGSLQPVGGSLAETVRALAARVLSADPRHPPVRAGELARLRVVIAFAGPGEPVADPMAVNPARDGLLVRGARGSLAFLPGEARTVSWALREARRLGVIEGSWRDTAYERFAVVTVREPAGARGATSRDAGGEAKEDHDAPH